jgi:hypothetical protein
VLLLAKALTTNTLALAILQFRYPLLFSHLLDRQNHQCDNQNLQIAMHNINRNRYFISYFKRNIVMNFNGFTDGAPGYLLTVSKHIQNAYLFSLCDGINRDFTLSKLNGRMSIPAV